MPEILRDGFNRDERLPVARGANTEPATEVPTSRDVEQRAVAEQLSETGEPRSRLIARAVGWFLDSTNGGKR